jgi:hypothetical protein
VLVVIYSSDVRISSAVADSPIANAVAGSILSAQMEYLDIAFTVLYVESLDVIPSAVLCELKNWGSDMEVCYDKDGVRKVRKYAELSEDLDPRSEPVSLNGGGFVITGGLGGVGLMTGKALAKLGATKLFLVSRSGRVSYEGQGLEAELSWLQTHSGSHVHILQCDVSIESEVIRMLDQVRSICAADGCSFRGVVHGAGILKDGLLRTGDATRVANAP